MALPPALTQWLRNVLLPEYPHLDRTYNDTLDALTRYPTLRPRTSVYTDEYGKPALLLCLHGTVPSVIAGDTYKIPVEVWVPHRYPDEGPFAYVRPTSTMMLSPGNYVDNNGRCYHPYISEWGSDPQNTNLATFLGVLSEIFSKEPPVYSRPTPEYGPPPTYPAQNDQQAHQIQRPPPLAPQAGQPVQPVPTGQPVQAPVPNHVQQPMHTGPVDQRAPPSQSTQAVPPLPPKPPQQWNQGAAPQPSTQFAQYQQHPQHSHQPNHVAQHPQARGPLPQQFVPQHRSRPSRTDIMDMDTMKSSDEPAPPKPPNPERMKALDELHSQLKKQADTIQTSVQADDAQIEGLWMKLSSLEAGVTSEISLLRQLEAQADKNNKILSDKMDQARRVITQARACEIPDIDSAVCAENVVFNQLYDLTAQEQAIDDTIYALSLALDRDKISVEPFMKHVRNLAREKFIKVATIDKIAVGAGLK
ncbi:Suppressor protein STP22 of temperature-sensitive alpha-factor receptor and arginine permease [Yarrowia sp. B02]|nr:Suppressor protein STP22 of temperature-sensitive alpha-factor receptor and arginine permease [Yarrowia sp. B02]